MNQVLDAIPSDLLSGHPCRYRRGTDKSHSVTGNTAARIASPSGIPARGRRTLWLRAPGQCAGPSPTPGIVTAYQIYCQNHDYGRSFEIYDEVLHDKASHIAENAGCAQSVEIHEATSGGGYQVLEGADGSALPDQ